MAEAWNESSCSAGPSALSVDSCCLSSLQTCALKMGLVLPISPDVWAHICFSLCVDRRATGLTFLLLDLAPKWEGCCCPLSGPQRVLSRGLTFSIQEVSHAQPRRESCLGGVVPLSHRVPSLSCVPCGNSWGLKFLLVQGGVRTRRRSQGSCMEKTEHP